MSDEPKVVQQEQGKRPTEVAPKTSTRDLIHQKAEKPEEDTAVDVPKPAESTPQMEDHDKQKLSQAALADALESFMFSRGCDLSGGFFNDEYSAMKEQGRKNIYSNHKLLEYLGGEPNAQDKSEPICTVCIPVAILKEDEETVAHTVSVIKEAQKKSSKPVEIVLWMNAKYQDMNELYSIEGNVEEHYNNLKQRLQTYTGDGLRIQTALQVLPKEQATISELRSNFMDAVSAAGVERGYGFDHPIIWVDADTTFMAKNTLTDMATNIKNFDALFVHANTQFSTEWGQGKPLSELDDATKAVVIHEIQRRQNARKLKKVADNWRYPEECGLGFALGTYLKGGGIDTTVPTSQSVTLMARVIKKDREIYEQKDEIAAELAKDELAECKNNWIPRVREAKALSPEAHLNVYNEYSAEYNNILHSQSVDKSIVPLFLLPQSGIASEIKYINSARLGTSGRRHHIRASQKGTPGLVDVDRVGYTETGGLFTNMKIAENPDSNQAEITQKDISELITQEEERFRSEASGSRKNYDPVAERVGSAVIKKMIKKNFKP